jgi:hypothetical protein
MLIYFDNCCQTVHSMPFHRIGSFFEDEPVMAIIFFYINNYFQVVTSSVAEYELSLTPDPDKMRYCK